MAVEILISDKILSTFTGREGSKFQSFEIIDMVLIRHPSTNKGSIMPADYCYNKTNKGNNFNLPFPLFEYDNGFYKYLGPDVKYEGAVYWKGILIGEWKEGVYKQLKNLEDQV